MGGNHLHQEGQTGSPSKGVPLGLCQEPSKDPETRLKGSKGGVCPAISPIASCSPTVLSCYTWQHMVALVDVPSWVLSLQNVHWSPGPATVGPLQPSLHQGQPGLQLGSLEGTGKERCVRLVAWKYCLDTSHWLLPGLPPECPLLQMLPWASKLRYGRPLRTGPAHPHPCSCPFPSPTI